MPAMNSDPGLLTILREMTPRQMRLVIVVPAISAQFIQFLDWVAELGRNCPVCKIRCRLLIRVRLTHYRYGDGPLT
jgi:hypothetical protein